MSNHQKMIILVLVLVTVIPLDRLDELDGFLQPVIGFAADPGERRDEG